MLDFIAVVSCVGLFGVGLIAGSMLYSSWVEIGIRVNLPSEAQLTNWQIVFPRASGLLKPFGMLLVPVLILAGFLTGNWLWFASAVFLLLLVPYTQLMLAGTNAMLAGASSSSDPAEIRVLIAQWGSRHHMRTALTFISFILAILASQYQIVNS